MKSKAKIEKQLQKKTNPELVQTIIEAKKKKNWLGIAAKISSPKIKKININLSQINDEAKDGETVVIAGKVLSQGEINKKIKVVALSFSAMAREKILKAKGETLTIFEEIKKNPEAKNVRFLI
jgi:large subunit ribosomal protein L18e